MTYRLYVVKEGGGICRGRQWQMIWPR